MEKTLKYQIKNRITDMGRGAVMTVNDFTDIASQKTVSKILERLCYDGDIRKLMHGIFFVPRKGMTYPEMSDVAYAISRKNSWRIAPAGKTALYSLNVISTPPKNYTYISDGTYRQYTIGEYKITFSHACPKLISDISIQTALLIQAVKELKGSAISDTVRYKIASGFKTGEKNKILTETKYMPKWISDTIRSIFGIYHA